MSLFAALTSVTLGAARIEPIAAPAPAVPEPRRFRLAYNPLGGPAGRSRFGQAAGAPAEPAPCSVWTPLPLAAGRSRGPAPP